MKRKLNSLVFQSNLPVLILGGASILVIIVLTIYAIADRSKVYRLTIAAGSQQGESYRFSQEMARVLAQYEPRIQITVRETDGTSESLKLLDQGEVQLAMAQADIPAPPTARLVSYLFPDMFQLIVTERSGIRQVADLRGKRVGLPPQGGGQYKSFLFLAEHYGLNPQNPLYTPMSESALNEAFRTNQVDAIFRVRAPGNEQVRELVEKYRGQLVAIDQGAAMKLKESALNPAMLPKGAYQGTPPIPATDLPTVAVQRLLLARQTLDPEVVQKITAILYERRQDLVKTIPLASYITQPSLEGGTGLPIHPGAQAFYDRDKPPFYQENADFLGLILSLSLLTWSSLSWFKSRFLQGQKDEADEYIERVVHLMNGQKTPETRRELRLVLSDAVQSLIDEKISLDSFQSFRVVWQIAMDELRDQEASQTLPMPPQGSQTPLQRQQPTKLQ